MWNVLVCKKTRFMRITPRFFVCYIKLMKKEAETCRIGLAFGRKMSYNK